MFPLMLTAFPLSWHEVASVVVHESVEVPPGSIVSGTAVKDDIDTRAEAVAVNSRQNSRPASERKQIFQV